MRGSGTVLIILMLALLLPVGSFGAEAVKLKYSLSLYSDEKGNGLSQPEGVACREDRLVVADSGNGRLVLFTLEGGEPKGGKEIRLPQILYPVRVKLNSKGEILVLDQRQRKIIQFTQEGVFKGFVETSGLPVQGSIVPAGMDIDGKDNIYLLDIVGARAVILDAAGTFQKQVDFPKDYGFFTDLAVDPKGTIFALDGANGIVYSNAKDRAVFSPISSSLKEDIRFGSNISADNNGMLYISDQNGGGMALLGQDGSLVSRQLSLGWKEGAVRYPAQSCIDKDRNYFIVADRENNRIQEFSIVK